MVTCRNSVARDPFRPSRPAPIRPGRSVAAGSVDCVVGWSGLGAVGEVEGALGVGEQAEGGGLADVEGAVVAEPAQDAGEVPDGGLQVEGVEGVEAGGDVGGGGGGAVVEPDAAGVQGGLLDAGGLVGVAAQHRLVHQLVQLARRRRAVPAWR